MTIRFLADEDLDEAIVEGLRQAEPAIDIFNAKSSNLRGAKDPALLEYAASENRILVTYDRNTMTRYYIRRMAAGEPCSGLFVVPQCAAVGEVIESLVVIWAASQAEEWHDRIAYLPLR